MKKLLLDTHIFIWLIISQAIKEKLTLATVDKKISHYSGEVDLLWM